MNAVTRGMRAPYDAWSQDTLTPWKGTVKISPSPNDGIRPTELQGLAEEFHAIPRATFFRDLKRAKDAGQILQSPDGQLRRKSTE